MWIKVFLLGSCLTLVAAGQVATIDLSKSSAEFPTNHISVHGCNAAYDSPDPRPPASCFPFPITVEIEGIQKAEGGPVLDILITNVGSSAIRLPQAPEPTDGGAEETFMALDVHSPPGPLNLVSESLVFADTNTASSLVDVGPGGSVIYRVPFKPRSQHVGDTKGTEKRQVQVELYVFSLKRGANPSADVSVQRGRSIFSDTYTIPN